MSRKIRVFLIGGAGFVAGACVRAMVDKDISIVGATEFRCIGEDIGEKAGYPPIGVKISPAADLEKLLDETRPDVVLECTAHRLIDIKDNVLTCLRHGVNVMAVGNGAYLPHKAAPEVAAEIEKVAKENGVTFLGGSSSEVWELFPALMSSCSQRIDKVTWEFYALCDEFGEAVLKEVGIGEPMSEWPKYSEGEDVKDGSSMAVGHLVEHLGLHEKKVEITCEPLEAKEDRYYPSTGVTVKKGYIQGAIGKTHIETEEGPVIDGILYGKNSDPGESHTLRVTISGEPDFHLQIDNFQGEWSTSTIMVNRIPDLITAKPGIVYTKDMRMLTYRTAQEYYIED